MNMRTRTSALQDEADWLPEAPEQLHVAIAQARARLVAAGRSSAEVQGITGWLVGKALGEPDTTTGSTRTRYRKILREVGSADPTDDPKRSPSPHRASPEPPIMLASRVLSGAGARAYDMPDTLAA